jgi:hypothetical protein
MQDQLERLYTFREIGKLWHISTQLANKIFRDRVGIINLAGPNRPAYRVPLSIVIEVLRERGYTKEQVDAAFRAAIRLTPEWGKEAEEKEKQNPNREARRAARRSQG